MSLAFTDSGMVTRGMGKDNRLATRGMGGDRFDWGGIRSVITAPIVNLFFIL